MYIYSISILSPQGALQLHLLRCNIAFKSHITTVPACSSGTWTNVLPHRNVIQQTQDMAPNPVTVYRHGADMSLCYPLMWSVAQEYTTTHFNVLGQTTSGNPSLTFHTHQQMLNFMILVTVVVSQMLGKKCIVPTES